MTPVHAATPDARVLNAVTVDVEDWPQSVMDPTLPLTDCFRANTRKLLAAFAARSVRGTFFVLGLAADKAPDLVREIQAAGHEIQSHGWGHELIHTQTPAQFRQSVERSKKLLEDITGAEVYGYRAPAFTITRRTLWALDVLVETGHRYDSSIFPKQMPRYGIDGAPRYPHQLRTPAGHTLYEFPVAVYEFAGRRVPVGGGGYFRLFPYWFLRRGVVQLNAQRQPATIYMHPYEYAPHELSHVGYPVSWRLWLHQRPGRHRFPGRVDRMLREFRFGAIADVITATHDWPQYTHHPES